MSNVSERSDGGITERLAEDHYDAQAFERRQLKEVVSYWSVDLIIVCCDA